MDTLALIDKTITDIKNDTVELMTEAAAIDNYARAVSQRHHGMHKLDGIDKLLTGVKVYGDYPDVDVRLVECHAMAAWKYILNYELD